ncbi:MAG: glycosyltransferase family 4 protein [Candidatus Eisenbacteria bacterium]
MSAAPQGKRLLFISLLPFYPETAGGAERTHLYLFQSLRRRGWSIQILCGTSLRSRYFGILARACARALSRLQPLPCYVSDEDSGFPSWRGIHAGWHPWHVARGLWLAAAARLGLRPGGSQRGRDLSAEACAQGLQGMRRKLDQLLAAFEPDVVLGHYGVVPLLHHAALRGYPSFYYTRGTRAELERRRYPAQVHFIANSPIAAARAAAASPEEVGLVLSMIDPQSYRAEPAEAGFITLINPIPTKGLDIAVEVARRMPEERFLFVKGGWFGLEEGPQTRLWMRRARRLANVTVWDFQRDMRAVYRVTDILLVPSRRECFGRVILEAHVNGIPVVAARIGGIPHTLGRGGILVEPEAGPAGYVGALARLREDRSFRGRLSALALENSLRREFDPEFQVEQFLRFVSTRARQAHGGGIA